MTASKRRRRWWVGACVVVAMAGVVGCDQWFSGAGLSGDAPAPGSPPQNQIESLLAQVQVIAERPDVPGYERSCKSGDGCVFGPAWTDDYDGPGGHDGCGTRDNVLALSLTEKVFKPGTRDCVVIAGQLADPFTGQSIDFTKQDAGAVQIDHTYPLSAAWDMGASVWPLDQRIRFANDVTYNLMAVSGPENQSKSDKLPSEWMPPDRAYHCFYAGRFLTVALTYRLPITEADRSTFADVARSCD